MTNQRNGFKGGVFILENRGVKAVVILCIIVRWHLRVVFVRGGGGANKMDDDPLVVPHFGIHLTKDGRVLIHVNGSILAVVSGLR